MHRYRYRFTYLTTLIGILLAALHLHAQSNYLGTPPVWNFSKKTYRAGTQNWDASQDKAGRIYWANNEGLLQYDGTHWTCFSVSNRTVVRSVAIDTQERIFVGAQSEFGYFAPGTNGTLQYHSLVHLIPKDQYQAFDDVWDIIIVAQSVFFRTQNGIFEYANQQIKVHKTSGSITALFQTDLGVIVQKDFNELLLLEASGLRSWRNLPDLKSEITGCIAWAPDTILLTSLKNGIFYLTKESSGRWATPADASIMQNRIYSAAKLYNGHLALGTSLSGLLVLDQNRAIYRHLHRKNGLQNNNILHTFSDRAGNLWLGLDSGIDCVVMDSPFSTIIPDGDLQGTGYAACISGQSLYLGVSNGVYTTSWSKNKSEQSGQFSKLPATDGQVWALYPTESQLLLGHHDGTFSISGSQAQKISDQAGAWTFMQVSEQLLIGGNYKGLSLYRKSGNTWVYDHKIKGLDESCRIMVRDEDGSIWVSHPYRGLYHIRSASGLYNDDNHVAFYTSNQGLPSDLNNFVYSIAGKAVFATENGIYRFDPQHKRFVPDQAFNEMLAQAGRIRYLKEEPSGSIWFVGEHEVGLLEVNDFGLKKDVKKRLFPELTGKLVGGFEFIYPYDKQNIFIGAEQGFIHYNGQARAQADTTLTVALHHVLSTGGKDSLLFAGYGLAANAKVSSKNNLFRISYSATDYKDPSFLKYRTRLIGLDKAWSAWSPETESKYTNLPPGTYTFEVQALRKDGILSPIVQYAFQIMPPWYSSLAALLFYFLGIIGLITWYLVRQNRKFELEKAQLTVQHEQITAEQQREVELSKEAISLLQNEKYEAELLFKNQELASATMHLVQKGEILLTIQENLNQILAHSTNPSVKKEIQQLLNLLNFDAKLDEDWEQFAYHFDQVHVDFLKRLREKYPQLSTNDFKLCAYLRMNLTTKEIAPLMNISVRGVEASRYRLRKKLDLPADSNLVEVMMQV